MILNQGRFYFLSDTFYTEFTDSGLMRNHGDSAGRPCYLAVKDIHRDNIFWFVPISHMTDKYHEIYDKKIEKYGVCDTIIFGNVLGQERAFLIQNMFPATSEWIENEYTNQNIAVGIDGRLQLEISKKVAKILALARQGKKVTFTNLIDLENSL